MTRNRLRSALAVLGVAIGIAAVICTAAIGAGASARVQAQLDALGENFVWIRSGAAMVSGARSGWGGARTLRPEDADAVVSLVPEVALCSPVLNGRDQIIVAGENWNTRYQGVTADYFAIRRRVATAGTVFGTYDQVESTRVLVLGDAVAARLFGDANPVGRLVRFGRFPYQVIGVLERRGTGRGGVDRDDVVFLPISTAQHSLNRQAWVNDIVCSVEPVAAVDRAAAQIESVLRVRHELLPGAPNDFQIQQPSETLALRAQSTRTIALLLTGAGAVSLIVGGVGIMNIMLVSVSERRREIGVRLAVGASVRDIRWQFLLEAALIALAGGLLGVAGGAAGVWAIAVGIGWPSIMSPQAAASAILLAASAGLGFGYLPAHRASGLDPIEALQTES